MKAATLDDWFDTLRGLPALDGHDVDVWTDHTEDVEVLAGRLVDRDCLVLFRERTPVTAALLERLPNLQLISQRSVYPHVDVGVCTRHGVVLCSNMQAAPSHATAEHAWARILVFDAGAPVNVAGPQAWALDLALPAAAEA